MWSCSDTGTSHRADRQTKPLATDGPTQTARRTRPGGHRLVPLQRCRSGVALSGDGPNVNRYPWTSESVTLHMRTCTRRNTTVIALKCRTGCGQISCVIIDWKPQYEHVASTSQRLVTLHACTCTVRSFYSPRATGLTALMARVHSSQVHRPTAVVAQYLQIISARSFVISNTSH